MSETLNVVFFKYKMSDPDGNVISETDEAISVITGKNQTFPQIDTALDGMNIGSTQDIIVPAGDAFGEYQKDLLIKVPKDQFNDELQEGQRIAVKLEDGSDIEVTVAAIKDDFIILDGNHPLSGIDLTFSVEVVSKRKATDEEIATESVIEPGTEN
jgi:FKBP-type peptidyl-prolyl cis-trans isomerase SlyD